MEHQMKKWTWIVLVLLSAFWLPSLGQAENEFSHEISVESMKFEWKLAGDTIKIRLSAKTDGWVGVGFNPTSRMKDANFIIGYVKDGEVKVVDHYGATERQHRDDRRGGGESHVSDISGKEENGVTELLFTIPLDSGGPKDRPIFTDKNNIILLAHGAGRDSFRTKHVFRSEFEVNLTTGDFKRVK
jgi:hypothetical protein